MWLGKYFHLNWELDMLLIHYEYHSDLLQLFSSAWPLPYFHSIYDSTYSSSVGRVA